MVSGDLLAIGYAAPYVLIGVLLLLWLKYG